MGAAPSVVVSTSWMVAKRSPLMGKRVGVGGVDGEGDAEVAGLLGEAVGGLFEALVERVREAARELEGLLTLELSAVSERSTT